jgi:regulator of protease activity HflC (stomatin/prohibitin superfamily)
MQDRELKLLPGWIMVLVVLAATAGVVASFIHGLIAHDPWYSGGAGVGVLLVIFLMIGFVVNGPNTARVTQLFGTYVGTLKEVGFFWGNPLYLTTKVTLRVRTFETGMRTTEEVKDPTTGKVLVPASQSRQPSKVNDREGTPIDIAAVVVWKVVIAAEAVFNVDKFEEFIHIQSEAALRNLASRYKYDGHEDDDFSLRGHIDEVALQLKKEVQDRVQLAGIEIVEARISYLAYASEIAASMLQRQQASATIAARQLIVEGAVGMVEHALESLSKKGVVDLDPERKAAMVCNLMVVLCGHTQAQPVLNTGTLHN